MQIFQSFSKLVLLRKRSAFSLLTVLLFITGIFIISACKKDDPDNNNNNSDPGVGLQMMAEGLTSPLTLTEAPDDSKRLFVVDQVGTIRIIGADGNLMSEPFLDIKSKMVSLNPQYDERGLLGLAFHPDYKSNGKFYIHYSAPLRGGAPTEWDNTAHISEFRVSGDANKADAGSERMLLQIDQPQANHAGGTLAFGPDGYLYISLGDGGAAHDKGMGHVEDWYQTNEGGNGQNTTNVLRQSGLLGSILRIDVNGGSPYNIPANNPFIGKTGEDEIYAFGFRNPYRFSFDMGGSRQLFVGDAGQHLWEEVSIVTKGGNYGWNVKEGAHCFSTADPKVELSSCPSTDSAGNPLIDPVIEFKNLDHPMGGGVGAVIVGGYVYRGSAVSQLQNKYIFGTWSASKQAPEGKIFVSSLQGTTGLWNYSKLDLAGNTNNELNHYLLGFGQDRSGEVYVLTTNSAGPSDNSGKVYKLVSK